MGSGGAQRLAPIVHCGSLGIAKCGRLIAGPQGERRQVAEIVVTTVVGAAGLAIGIAYGAVTRWADFCALGALADVQAGDSRRLRSWLLAIATAVIGTNALHMAGAIDIYRSIYLGTDLGRAFYRLGTTHVIGRDSLSVARIINKLLYIFGKRPEVKPCHFTHYLKCASIYFLAGSGKNRGHIFKQ